MLAGREIAAYTRHFRVFLPIKMDLSNLYRHYILPGFYIREPQEWEELKKGVDGKSLTFFDYAYGLNFQSTGPSIPMLLYWFNKVLNEFGLDQ